MFPSFLLLIPIIIFIVLGFYLTIDKRNRQDKCTHNWIAVYWDSSDNLPMHYKCIECGKKS